MAILTEEINHEDLMHGEYYYIVGGMGDIGIALDVGGNIEVQYSIGTIYDISKYKFFSIPKLQNLL